MTEQPFRITLPADLHAHAANGQPRNEHGVIYEPEPHGPRLVSSYPSVEQCDRIIKDVSRAIEIEKTNKAQRIKAALDVAKGEI